MGTVRMNVYHDGQHYVGKMCQSPYWKQTGNTGMQDAHKKRMRTAFRSAWDEAREQNLKDAKRKEYIQDRFPDLLEADGYDAGNDVFAMYDEEVYKEYEKETLHLLYMRKKRFMRKANLNRWNYFVTVTYDDDKMTAEAFPDAVRRTLSTHSSEFDWNYCAVFEEGEQGGRIHLHALAYIPEGQEHGKFFARAQWSQKRRRYETCNDHTFFHEKFGNCDFEHIDSQNWNRIVNYLTKYMTKTNVKLIYSRGVPDEFHDMEVDEKDIWMMYKTQTGYIAMLADSAFGLMDADEELLCFEDTDDLKTLSGRIVENPWKQREEQRKQRERMKRVA